MAPPDRFDKGPALVPVRIRQYLRLLARDLIEKKSSLDERDKLWEDMSIKERAECNDLVDAIFGPWVL